MEKIIIHKLKKSNITKEGVMIRISPDVNKQIEALSDESGTSKARIIDVLLRKALEVVEVQESDI